MENQPLYLSLLATGTFDLRVALKVRVVIDKVHNYTLEDIYIHMDLMDIFASNPRIPCFDH